MAREPRAVPISPKSMVDSVADWPLRRVVEHLRRKEKEGSSQPSPDCRVYCRSSIRFLNTVIDELASEFGVSRGRMCRCLSYHGIAILQNDAIVQGLVREYRQARRLALERNSPSIADIINSLTPYSPLDVDASKTSFRVYDAWVMAEIEDKSQVCGVYPGQLAQIAMLRSILTCDLPAFEPVVDRLTGESRQWDLWMSFRLSVLEVAVARWESLLL